jgi:hypothetical protein
MKKTMSIGLILMQFVSCFPLFSAADSATQQDSAAQQEKNEQLMHAIIAQDEVGVSDSLQAGADVNKRVTISIPSYRGPLKLIGFPLNEAAANSTLAIIKLLLDAKASVRKRSTLGGTALHRAVVRGDREIVAALLAAKSNPNAQTIVNLSTPLHLALSNSVVDEEIFAMLLHAGADLNKQDEYGNTPLHLASLGGCCRIVAQLLDNGALIQIQNKAQKTPLENIFTFIQHRSESDQATDLRSCARLLIAYGAITDKPEYQALFNKIRTEPETIELWQEKYYAQRLKPSLLDRLILVLVLE